jgi:hypothetical protein
MTSHLKNGLLNGLLTVLISLPLLAQAQVYKQVDEQGNVTFTDAPAGDAQPVDIPPANTAEPVDARDRPAAPSEKTTAYQSLTITSPKNNGIIPNGPGNFSVQLALSPALQPGHQSQLLLDGKIYSSGTQNHFTLTNISRGNHSLQAQVVDEDGKVLIASTPISVQVYRPSTAIYDNNENTRLTTPPNPVVGPINPRPRAPK